MHLSARRLMITATVTALTLLGTTGCFLPYDPPGAEMTIANETKDRLGIHIGDSEGESNFVRPGETRRFDLTGSAPKCTEWTLRVYTEDGARTASIGPPVCHGDE